MKESDWKIFKKIKEEAIQKFCIQALKEFDEAIKNGNEDPHNRYLLLSELVKNRDKQMRLLFNYHSRSKAKIQLIMIRDEGLVDKILLSKLSKEILEATDPEIHGI